MKQISKYQIVDSGIDHAQYFQGCGVAFTEFDRVVTGCGENAMEAFEDALDQIAQDGTDGTKLYKSKDYERYVSKKAQKASVLNYLIKSGQIKKNGEYPEECELYYYLSIRYSVKD